MNNKTENIEKIISELSVLMITAHEFEKIVAMPNCNDCGRNHCQYKVRIGDTVRFNCPLWEKKA